MVDVNAQVAAVTRGVRTVEREGEPAHVQTLSQEYASPIDDVWDAVTSAERIPRWFLPITGDLRLGGRYQLQGNAGGEVLDCAPPEGGAAGYRVTWEYMGGVSWLAVRLESVGDDRTRLELEHTARAADVPPGFWEQFGPGATGVGWDGGLLGLALHLAGGPGIAPDEAEAWAATDEGLAFYRGAADAWGRAHAASGADAEAAARAADATYAFYTGQG
ncbi:SRPBCC domain-containing protein [Microbacterium sp.]|uniref:SRPBCC domain-containing protein n=1 Tax=Microbacterium sp. TaxID=51671 RepID=UPI003221AFAB